MAVVGLAQNKMSWLRAAARIRALYQIVTRHLAESERLIYSTKWEFEHAAQICESLAWEGHTARWRRRPR